MSESSEMVTAGLWIRLEAKPGRDEDVATFLRSSLGLVQKEPTTTAWFAIRLGRQRLEPKIYAGAKCSTLFFWRND